MHVQPLFTMNNDAISSYVEAWFMNKVCASGVLKIPISILVDSKQRSMQTILGFSSINCKSQKQVRRCATNNDVENRLNGFDCASSAKIGTEISRMSLSQRLADDEHKEIGKMTLRDMKRMLRKAIEKPLNIVDCAEPVSGNHSCSSSDSIMCTSVHNEVPSVTLELLLEDSTSNSSDSMSLKTDLVGISSTSGISGGLSQANSADLLCGHKRLLMVSELSEETEVAEDDEWTLEKWQRLYHKQSTGRKRLRKACKEPVEISESSGDAYSSSLSLALLDASAGISEVASLQDASSLFEKVVKGNSEIDSSDCKPHERQAAGKDSLPTAGISALEQSCQMLPSMVRLELEEESEIASSKASMPGRLQKISKSDWALKSCSNTETNPFLKSALQQAMLVGKTSSDISVRKAGEVLNFYPEKACIKVSGQRKHFEEITRSLSLGNPSGLEEGRTATYVHNTDGTSKPRSISSEDLQYSNVNHAHTTLNNMTSNVPTEQLEGTLPLEHFKGISHLNSKGLPAYSASLNCMETLEIEEEQEPLQKPAKIPCRRKAISPMSQEFLLKASKLGGFGISSEKRDRVDVPKWTGGANDRNAQNLEAPQGSSCHVKEQWQASNVHQSEASSLVSPEKFTVGLTSTSTLHSLSNTHKTAFSSPKSPSETQSARIGTAIISTSGSSPLMPAKGILKSSCQGLCGCEECASVRSRAERASEFSQRQMQDIEGLAVKLMKDLSVLRNIVEDRLLQGSVNQSSPRRALSVDQLKKVTANALETEEKAKKWLVRMARDCNRYCKIMRMQGRKLTFADESGGKLCHVKVFRSEPVSDSSMGLHGRSSEANGNNVLSLPSEPPVEVACPVEATTTSKV